MPRSSCVCMCLSKFLQEAKLLQLQGVQKKANLRLHLIFIMFQQIDSTKLPPYPHVCGFAYKSEADLTFYLIIMLRKFS